MRKAICVLGPTAVGKTALSAQIAEKHNGVLLSVDSIQVYIGLDIISGKDKDAVGDIPLKLVDLASPQTSYSVSDYLLDFKKELETTSQLPILVGGTGFYLYAVLNGIETVNAPPDMILRQKLSLMSVDELQKKLQEINPLKFNNMNNSDKNNPRRLIRAIEIILSHPERSEGSWDSSPSGTQDQNDILFLGLYCDKKILKKKIDKRVDERLKQGALTEVESLFKDYDSLAPQIKQASGYRQLFEYLKGECTLEKAVENWKIAEHQNAKKQMTWFRKQKNIQWFDRESPDFEARIMGTVEDFLQA